RKMLNPLLRTLYFAFGAALLCITSARTSASSSAVQAESEEITELSRAAPWSRSRGFKDGRSYRSLKQSDISSSNVGITQQNIDIGILDDIETIRERRLSFVVAGAGTAANISQWLSTLDANGKWPDSEVDYTTGCNARRANWPAETHWQRIVTMAAAWHGGLPQGDQYVQSATLLDSVSRAMDYWFINDFTDPSCLDSGGLASCPCGTPGFWNTNWYSNIIGIPLLLSQGCLLITNNSLTPTQLSNCTHITGRAYGTFDHNINGVGFLTGANTLDVAKVGIDQALLTTNVSMITDAYMRIHNEVVIEDAVEADGIRPDGSFGQHGGIIYNGNYGQVYTTDVLGVEIDAGGTQFAAADAGTGSQSAFETLMNGNLWMIYRNVLTGILHWDFSVLGRFISFPVADEQATGSININITEIQQLGEEWDSGNLTSVYNSLIANTTDANVGSINGNRMFYNNDYMVHRGPGYVTTLRMYSSRTKNTECTNLENPLGFHLADGVLYTYLQGDEYEDISVAWDWNLIPGITVDYNATTLDCGHTQFTGIEAFVGGASDGMIGAAAMRFTNPYTQTLSWQKAWFFLDDDVQYVMISSINSSTDTPVFSVLDQKRHNGVVLVDGLPLQSKTNFSRVQSLWHDDVGYTFDAELFGQNFDLAVDVGLRTGDWSTIGVSTVGTATVDLFSAWIDHRSTDVPVSYTTFPAVDQGTFLRKSPITRLKTIQNDRSISAVFDEVHRVVMVVFWDADGGAVQFAPSTLEAAITVESTGNAVVLWRLDQGSVTVSDPSQMLSDVQLTFTVGPLGNRPSGWGPRYSKQLSFVLPTDGLAGSSLTQKL
ncbi:Chondroitinase-AC, partial [Grifola frondosa]